MKKRAPPPYPHPPKKLYMFRVVGRDRQKAFVCFRNARLKSPASGMPGRNPLMKIVMEKKTRSSMREEAVRVSRADGRSRAPRYSFRSSGFSLPASQSTWRATPRRARTSRGVILARSKTFFMGRKKCSGLSFCSTFMAVSARMKWS